nr:myoD family inhibitor isoform X3 [Aotus nancymaae]
MYQVSGQRSSRCNAPHGAPSAAPGPAQTLSLLPGLEVVTGSTHPVEAAPEEGSLEEAATPMPQGNGPGVPQALDSTDLDVPTEAVTCQPQGNPLGCTPLLPNGSGHPSELGSTRRAGNGALSGPKAHRKLQTHPSLASQGSKKSKSSTKSTASQIPLQAQEGKHPIPSFPARGLQSQVSGSRTQGPAGAPSPGCCLEMQDLNLLPSLLDWTLVGLNKPCREPDA